MGATACVAVAKNGVLVLDDSYHFGAKHRPLELMSAAKTITAALMGVAVTRGLFDLDTPIRRYGVKPLAEWNKTGVDFFHNLTARHLLAQNSGRGSFEPGTQFSYDSNEYIAHLSYLLNATLGPNTTEREWATREFAAVLGIPQLFENQRADP